MMILLFLNTTYDLMRFSMIRTTYDLNMIGWLVGWFDFQPPGKQFFIHVGTEPPLPGYYQYFRGVNVPCSRTQHGLTRVGLESPTSGSGVRGINHQATALPDLNMRTTRTQRSPDLNM